MRKIKIGVIGSMLDKKIDEKLITLAKRVGQLIAEKNAILVFGFESDFESLPVIAAKESEKFDGRTIAFLAGSKKIKLTDLKSKIIITNLDRGGGREFSFIRSCNVIISLAGGSGTLMEIAMAYQAKIPIVALQNSGGWSSKLVNKFLDERKRQKIIGVETAKEAVKRAIKLARSL